MSGNAFRLALAQLDVEPNRPDVNVRRVLDAIEQQRRRGADLVVFSEMVVPGYMIGDAFEREAFLRDCEAYNADIASASEGLTVIWGNVLTDRTKRNWDGTLRKYNAAFGARDGQLLAPLAIKTHLPTYRQFHDRRHFTSLRDLAHEDGVPLSEKLLVHDLVLGDATHPVGVMLCEDMWWEDYGENIAAMLRDNGAEFLINLSASPWGAGKAAKRDRVVRSLFAGGTGIPLIYVNNVGFQDIGKTMFAFDGGSAIYDGSGDIIVQAAAHEATVLEASFDPSAEAPGVRAAEGDDGPRQTRVALVYAIRQFMANIPLQNVLIGLSGGIDSSVTAALFVEAMGAERVFGINMPTHFNSARTRTSAERLARNLGIAYAVAPIEDSFDYTRAALNTIRFATHSGTETLVQLTPFDEENVQARIRGSGVLAGVAAALHAVISCNSNKTEMAFGYATLYGDLIGAIAPLGDLLKGQVCDLAREINASREIIPHDIFETVPSAELSPDQNVEEGKGDPFWYDYHDQLVRHFVEYLREPEEILSWYLDGTLEQRFGVGDGAFAQWFGTADAFIADLEAKWRLLHQNVFKRYQAPPVVKVSTRAFGFDYHESQVQPCFTRRYAVLKLQILKQTDENGPSEQQ